MKNINFRGGIEQTLVGSSLLPSYMPWLPIWCTTQKYLWIIVKKRQRPLLRHLNISLEPGKEVQHAHSPRHSEWGLLAARQKNPGCSLQMFSTNRPATIWSLNIIFSTIFISWSNCLDNYNKGKDTFRVKPTPSSAVLQFWGDPQLGNFHYKPVSPSGNQEMIEGGTLTPHWVWLNIEREIKT